MVRALCIFCLASAILAGAFVRDARCLAGDKETDHAALFCQRLVKHACLKIENTLYYCQEVKGRTLKNVYMLQWDSSGELSVRAYAGEVEVANAVDEADKKWAPDGCVRLSMKAAHFWGEKKAVFEEHDQFIRPARWKRHDPSMGELFLFMQIEKELSERKAGN
jgi:hypothetical protein